jgi:hypothetical protein
MFKVAMCGIEAISGRAQISHRHGAVGLRKVLSLVLTGLLVAQLIAAQEPATDSVIKQRVAALPPKARVVVELKDGTSARGQLQSRTDQDFTIKEQKGGQTRNIAYDQVRSVAQMKGGPSKKTWIILGVVVVGVLVIVALVARSSCGHICGA